MTNTHRHIHRLGATALVVGLCLFAHTHEAGAQATDDPSVEAEARSKKGVELYQAGKYPEAVREMVAAYQLVPDPGLLYNIARIYHKMKEWDLSEQYYKRYVSDTRADPALVEKSLVYLKQLRTEAHTPDDIVVTDIDAKQSGGEGAGGGEVDNNNGGDEKKKTPDPVATEPDRTAGYLVGGLGVAAVATGAVFGFLASKQADALADKSSSYEERLASQSDGATYALIADISYGVGVVALGVGTILLISASPEEAPRSALRITPHLTPDGGGAALEFGFD